jgi:hypothetical protein
VTESQGVIRPWQEAEKDAARLDWLQSRPSVEILYDAGEMLQSFSVCNGKSLREAIDKAMKEVR